MASLFLAFLRGTVALTERVAPAATDRLLQRLFLTPPRHALRQAERAFLAKAQAFTVPFGAARLSAWSMGEGPTVLLMHGWGGRGGQWRMLARALSEAGFRAVFFDAPAHGNTPGRRSSLPQFIDALRAVAESLGPIHAVIGHSLGGAAAVLALSRGLKAERAILVAAPAYPTRFYRVLMNHLRIPKRSWPAHEAAFEARMGMAWSSFDVPRHLAGNSCPVLVIHDRHDAEVPFAEAEALAAAGSHVALRATGGLGHRRILKDPAVIQAIAAYLGAPRTGSAGTSGGSSRGDQLESAEGVSPGSAGAASPIRMSVRFPLPSNRMSNGK